MRTMTVGRVAALAGVGVETVRFYETSGLLEEPARRASGYREYDQQTVDRLRFIQRAKDLGFTLAEVKELLSLRAGSGRPCGEVRRRAEAKIAEIEAKVALLLRMKDVLGRLAASCGAGGRSRRCPILEVLDGHHDAGSRSKDDEHDGGVSLSGERDQGQGGRPGDAPRPRRGRVPRAGRGRR